MTSWPLLLLSSASGKGANISRSMWLGAFVRRQMSQQVGQACEPRAERASERTNERALEKSFDNEDKVAPQQRLPSRGKTATTTTTRRRRLDTSVSERDISTVILGATFAAFVGRPFVHLTRLAGRLASAMRMRRKF